MGIEENRLASATGGREANLLSRRGCAKPVRWTQGRTPNWSPAAAAQTSDVCGALFQEKEVPRAQL